MKWVWFWKLALTASLFWCGCTNSEPRSSPPTATQKAVGEPQPKLPTIKLWLASQEIVAEQALTRPQIETGMMFRKQMGTHEGMLFIFAVPHQAAFWMRNTLLPLSCAYIDPDGVILEIHDMQPLDETAITAAGTNVQYVLEMNQGWFKQNNISTGTVVRTERGSLLETYLGKR